MTKLQARSLIFKNSEVLLEKYPTLAEMLPPLKWSAVQ